MKVFDLIKQLIGWDKPQSELPPYESSDTNDVSLTVVSSTPHTLDSDFLKERLNEGKGVQIEDISSQKVELDVLIVDEPVHKAIIPKELTDPKESFASTKSSLLDNQPYMCLTTSVCKIIEKIEEIQERSDSEETIKSLRHVKSKMCEALYLSGAKPITGDTQFDTIRHIPVTDDILKDGVSINIVEDGVAIENRVMLLAKVKPINK